ncbi:hypothetical protein [Kitasatospora paracochleata]|uniref:hypothetical protein n=1 Tax=Kitasatospora paracochleata TaxID=58354 RepID=UPI0031DAA4F1
MHGQTEAHPTEPPHANTCSAGDLLAVEVDAEVVTGEALAAVVLAVLAKPYAPMFSIICQTSSTAAWA